MVRSMVSLEVIDNATPVLKIAQTVLRNSRVEAHPFPVEAAISVRDHRAHESVFTAETLPSPAFLRWLADHIEADLAARG